MNSIDPSITSWWSQREHVRIAAAELSVAEIRESLREMIGALEGPSYVATAIPEVREVDVATVAGQVPVRCYRPRLARQKAVINFHGGGFVAGDIDTHDKTCRAMADVCRSSVLSVGYPLSPEVGYPVMVDACYDVLQWAIEQWGSRNVLVAGDSAGGYLAAAVTRRATAAGHMLAGQLLVYPVLDFTSSLPATREHATSIALHQEDVITYGRLFLGSNDPVRKREASLLSGDLRGLPPTVIATAEYDPLRDDGATYAALLAQHQVPIVFQPNLDLIHGWLDWTEVSDRAKRARLLAFRAASELLTE